MWHENYFSLRLNRNVLELARSYNENVNKIHVLDLGCGGRPYESLFKNSFYVGTDIDHTNMTLDVVADNSCLPFKPHLFDLIIISETLEHTLNYENAIKEILRIAKPNSLIYISVPFMYPIHSWPYDYYRFTEFKLRHFFKDQEIISIQASNTFFTTWLFLLQYMITYIISAFPRQLRWVRYIIITSINLLALIIDDIIVKRILRLVQWTGLNKLIEKRINYPQGLKAFLESMPCGYAMVVKKTSSG